MQSDLLDEQAKQLLRLLVALGRQDLFELVGKPGEGGRVGRRARCLGMATFLTLFAD